MSEYNLRQDVEDIFNVAYNSGIDWLSSTTIMGLALDMRQANEDTAMDDEFRNKCNRVINEMLLVDSGEGY